MSVAARRVVLICGPPGAGKTTLAHDLGLEVYDRDDPQWRGEAHFTQVIRELAKQPNARAAVIRSGARSTSRKRTASLIDATEVRVLAVDPDTCIRRVLKRNRPRPSMPRQIAAVREWWRKYNADSAYSSDLALTRRRERYGPEYEKARREWRAVVESGQARCAEPVCLMTDRRIRPGDPWDLCHDPSGRLIIGPGHRRCNRSEAARRGNAQRARGAQPRSWVL